MSFRKTFHNRNYAKQKTSEFEFQLISFENLESLIRNACINVKNIIPCKNILFYLIENSTLNLSYYFSDNPSSKKKSPEDELKIGEGLPGLVAKQSSTKMIDLENNTNIDHNDIFHRFYLGLPITFSKKTLGVISMSRAEKMFSVEEVKRISELVKYFSVALYMQKIIDDKTKKIRRKDRELQAIMDNTDYGLFTIDESMYIDNNYSKTLLKIFNMKDISNLRFDKLISANTNIEMDVIKRIKDGLSCMFGEGYLSFDLNKHLLPNEIFHNNGSILEMAWSPILENESIVKIIFSIRDITDLKVVVENKKNEKLEVEVFNTILRFGGTEKFVKFSEETIDELDFNLKLLERANKSEYSHLIRQLFGSMHTMKGLFRIYQMGSVVNGVHEMETYLNKVRLNPDKLEKTLISGNIIKLKVVLEKYLSIYQNKIKGFIKIEKNIYEEEVKKIYKNIGLNFNEKEACIALRRLFELQKYVSIEDILHNQLAALPEISELVNKECPNVHFYCDNVLFTKKWENVLNSVFTHLLRNSIDHGIESTDIRIEKLKPLKGNIVIEFVEDPSRHYLAFSDDGGGLNIDLLRAKSGNFESKDNQMIANSIFNPGTSTAKTVSEISGRGVGMDAVRSLLRENNGEIEIELLSSKLINGSCEFRFKVYFPNDAYFIKI